MQPFIEINKYKILLTTQAPLIINLLQINFTPRDKIQTAQVAPLHIYTIRVSILINYLHSAHRTEPYKSFK